MSGKKKNGAKRTPDDGQAGGALLWIFALGVPTVFWGLVFWAGKALTASLSVGMGLFVVLPAVLWIVGALIVLNLLFMPWLHEGEAPPPPSGRRRERPPAT